MVFFPGFRPISGIITHDFAHSPVPPLKKVEDGPLNTLGILRILTHVNLKPAKHQFLLVGSLETTPPMLGLLGLWTI